MKKETKIRMVNIDLTQRFPEIFKHWIDRGIVPMYIYNFSIRQGWYSLLFKYLEKFDEQGKRTGNFAEISDIKEKFGGLDISFYGGDAESFKIMLEAYKESYTVCEFCSSPNAKQTSMKTDGWIYTICDSCYNNKFHKRTL